MSGQNPTQQSLAHGAAAARTSQVGLGSRFIQKNQAIRIDLFYVLFPPRPRFGNVGPVLLGGINPGSNPVAPTRQNELPVY